MGEESIRLGEVPIGIGKGPRGLGEEPRAKGNKSNTSFIGPKNTSQVLEKQAVSLKAAN